MLGLALGGLAVWGLEFLLDRLELIDLQGLLDDRFFKLLFLGVPGVGVITGLWEIINLVTNLRRRILRIDSQGFAFGPTFARLKRLPWSEIINARVSLTEHLIYGKREGVSGQLQVSVADGSTIVLPNSYGVPLEVLARILSPLEPDRLADPWPDRPEPTTSH